MTDDPPLLPLQSRVLAASPSLRETTPLGLLQSVRKTLLRAYDEDRLRTGQAGIYKWVKLDPVDDDMPLRTGEHIVVGGLKDFQRDPAKRCLERDDGAWIHFTILVRSTGRNTLDLLAYDFEIVFPGEHTPHFLRFDMNPPGHPNESKELRSHVHPGNDDLQAPAPVMTPEELLILLLWGLRPRDPLKRRV